MEFANKPIDPLDRRSTPISLPKLTIKEAEKGDKAQLTPFLEQAFFRHLHADWYEPLFWFGEPNAVTLISEREGKLAGALIVAADPPPAAWIRAAAFDYMGLSRNQIKIQFLEMIERAAASLGQQGITDLCWMSPRRWAEPWLVDAGFRLHTTMVTYRKADLRLPTLPSPPPEIKFRPVLPEDMRALALIEETAYHPIWRHSQRGLHKAWRSALVFDVVLCEEQVIGFQHSTRASQDDAHLARITIHPDFQGQGIGSHLLARAIRQYERMGIKHVTLNTQSENIQAQKMYNRFGFQPTHYRWPLSTLTLSS